MAVGIEQVKRTNQFIKSSTDDYQDPVFLTFAVDFFPATTNYPKFDGLANSALLKPANSLITTGESLGTAQLGHNELVEFSALHWLNDYYGSLNQSLNNPAVSLAKVIAKLKQVQDSPWYFQSVVGIGDLWKSAYRVKEGTRPATLTFNCVDSIEQPLTEMAENYMHAAYDQERLAYRLPDNLRWFDMTIVLFEIRDIADYSGQFFQTDSTGKLVKGLRTIKFNCKMCEFDFSNFLGGAQSEHRIYTEEKPFSPSFDVKVGWVEQEKVNLEEANDYRHVGIFSGALDTLNNRLSRFIQNATRLPAGIVGSVLNEIQTFVEIQTMGNVYTGINAGLNEMNNISGDITGRNPVVGPPIGSNVGTDIYEDQSTDQVSNIGNSYETPSNQEEVDNMGDQYPSKANPPEVSDMGDLYETQPTTTPGEMGEVYETQPAPTPGDMGDVYEDSPNQEVNEIGETYEEEPSQEISSMGDNYENVPPTQVNTMDDVYEDESIPGVSNIGDVYPDEPATPAVGEIGDIYQDEQVEDVNEIGDAYPGEANTETVKEIADIYQKEEADDVRTIGETYDREDSQEAEPIGDVYQQNESTEDVDELGDVYTEESPTEEVDELGDVYTGNTGSEEIDDMGDTYQ